MKANELRIGNYVLDLFGYVQKVTPAMILEQYQSDLASTPYLWGASLTEEWLLKFGFDVLPSKHTNKTFDKDLLSVVLCGNYQYKNGRTYFNSWRILESQPKYVHQLQNLYFALTGEELTIKDDVGN